MNEKAHDRISLLITQLKKQREKLGWTQSEAALHAGIRQANYSRMESGRQRPNLETLIQIADALGMDVILEEAAQTVFHIMYLDQVVTDVTLSRDKKEVSFIKYEADGIHQPFSGSNLTMERFYRFLKSRCYEDGRSDLPQILRQANISANDPYIWVRLSHGVTYEDFFWIRFNNEQITWDEVRIR